MLFQIPAKFETVKAVEITLDLRPTDLKRNRGYSLSPFCSTHVVSLPTVAFQIRNRIAPGLSHYEVTETSQPDQLVSAHLRTNKQRLHAATETVARLDCA